ncbi:MAG TPA: hypothetical protein PKX12_13615 [Spirochaetota bacterium]|nr:hypothetical protein [Spirochaetota bacterium]
MKRQGEITNFPDPRQDVDRHLALVLFSWAAQMALDDAVRSRSPFAMLRLDADARPDDLSILQFQKNFKEKK